MPFRSSHPTFSWFLEESLIVSENAQEEERTTFLESSRAERFPVAKATRLLLSRHPSLPKEKGWGFIMFSSGQMSLAIWVHRRHHHSSLIGWNPAVYVERGLLPNSGGRIDFLLGVCNFIFFSETFKLPLFSTEALLKAAYSHNLFFPFYPHNNPVR